MQKLSNFLISKRGLMVKFARLTSTCETEIQYELENAYGLLTYCHIARFASFLR